MSVAIAFGFISLTLWAMISDARRFIIPNAAVAGLALLFGLRVLVLAPTGVMQACIAAALVLAAGLAMFALGWIAAGDVKLAAVLSLWSGGTHTPGFLMLAAMLGGAFALIIILTARAAATWPALGELPGLRRVVRWGQRGICPYGVPIGLAALLLAPRLLSAV